ncbi:hypothetical protein PMSD_14110 [Paenibacillus macquariensis subsp. defensor]|nr:hypothetical protein PMSD_14110 [Paenibacillus macquariensis subsp. defensor]
MSFKLIIFQGPSAAGKSTLQALLDLPKVVTWTSRASREGEVNGVDYHFVTKETMCEMFIGGDMLEMTEYQGNYYGTSIVAINQIMNAKQMNSVVMDAKGVKILKERFHDRILVIGVTADKEQCRLRLLSRNTDDKDVTRRLASYEEEVSTLSQCDLVIYNTEENREKAKRMISYIKRGLVENNELL